MADDSREGSSTSKKPFNTSSPSNPEEEENALEEQLRQRRQRARKDFPESQAGKLWKAFGNPENSPNELASAGTYNTAGGHRPKEPTWRDAFRFDMFTGSDNNPNRPNFYQQPCARDALLVGIGSGGAVGGLRFILKGLQSMLITTNYAVGGFAVASIGMFYWCQQRRREEALGMAAAVAGMKMMHEKKAKEEAEAKRQREAEAEAERIKKENEKRWYKIW